jgi:hypothetical protein
MKDLNKRDQMLEKSLGMISGSMIYLLWELSKAAGSMWDIEYPFSMDIIVTEENAFQIYGCCKEIRSGYSIGLNPDGMKKVKAAREQAHRFLVEIANDPNTPIDRKIEIVKLTSK